MNTFTIFEIVKSLSLWREIGVTCDLESHCFFEHLSTQATQKQNKSQIWKRVGFLWETNLILCKFLVIGKVSQFMVYDWFTLPIWTSQIYLLMCLFTLRCATYFLLASLFKNLTIFNTLSNFPTFGFSYSFLTSCFKRARAPYTSPSPCQVAKKIPHQLTTIRQNFAFS